MGGRPAVLVFNPWSGGGRAPKLAGRVAEILGRSGYELHEHATERPDHATELARQAADTGAEVVFAMGGDGTLREVAAGLLGTDTALAPLPLGTTNVIAYSLGLPAAPLPAAQVLAGAATREIDVGSVAGRPFLMQCSFGLDGAALARVSPVAKRRFGKAAIVWAGVRELLSSGLPGLEIEIGDNRYRASFVAACNLPHYAGRMALAPGADPADALLDVVIFAGESRAALVGFARDLVRGRHTERSDVERAHASRLRVSSARPFAVQTDGDYVERTTGVEIELGPERLKVLAP